MNKARWIFLLSFALLSAACGINVAERNTAGNRDHRSENYDAAIRAYQVAQVEAPDRPEAYFNAASALVAVDDLQGAEAALIQALENADDNMIVEAYFNLGNVYHYMGQYARAVEAYQEALLIDPDDEDTRYNLEITLLRWVKPTPTAIEQQTEPEVSEADPETTPTDIPGGFDGPTPSPPPLELEPSSTPVSGQGEGTQNESGTPVPQTEGEMTMEEAERILDQLMQDQEALREYLQDIAAGGVLVEKDW